MRPTKYPKKNLIELFYKKKVLTMQQVINKTGCAKMTAWRILSSHSHGYLTSYNFNATYYTLADIPEFDNHGLWTFKKVRFSKYGSLTNTVTQLICHSTTGMEKREVEEILNVNTAQIVAKLFQKGSINRKKINGIFFYFNPNNTKMEKQLKARQTERMEKMALLLPEPEQIIAVLVDIIQHPQSKSHPYQIYQRLSIEGIEGEGEGEGIKITPDEIKAILLYYNLSKKKRLKY
ncbi:hypothetical protein ACFLQP_02785 [Acidobacteriota bacterium]